MRLYGGIDLHANNSVIVLLDEHDHKVYQKRLRNDLPEILTQLAPYQPEIAGLVVESTYNWYWLVDGLMEAGYRVHLANPAAIQQYSGLKYTDDKSDARWLAQMLGLGVLPEGYIYPKAERAVRDLLRKRSQLVRQKTANLVSIQNLVTRNTGQAVKGNALKKLTDEDLATLLSDPDLTLAVQSNWAVIQCLEEQIAQIERVVTKRVKLKGEFQSLLPVRGIGQTLGLTIMLETGESGRFASVGHFAS